MRGTALLLLLTASLCSACGARSNPDLEDASSSGSVGGGSASTGTGGASTGTGGASTSTGTGGAPPTEVWSRQHPGALARHPLAVDGSGHIWLLGAGAHLWKSSPHGDAEIDAACDGGEGFSVRGQAIHADAAGGVLVAGEATREPGAATTLAVGGAAISFPFAQAAFVVKLDAGGKHVWSHVYDAGHGKNPLDGDIRIVNVGADSSGRWHVLTSSYGTVDLGAGPVVNDGPIDLILSPTGEHVSDVLLPNGGWVSLSFTVEPTGHLWLAGGSQHCGYGLKAQRFDPAGNLLVDVCPPSTCWAESPDLALDGVGGVFITEDAESASHCDDQIFLRRMDASGNVAWTLKGSTAMFSTTVATTSAGHAVLGASFYGAFELGSGPLTSPSDEDGAEVLLGDIDPGGKVLSALHYDGKGDHQIRATAIDPFGARVIAGNFSGDVDFGNGPLQGTSEPSDTAFVARILP
jgi:hypothetical protein